MNATITQLVPPHPADAPARPEHLAGSVLRSLGRSFEGRFAWGSARTIVLGLISFGYWPLIAWIVSFRDYIRLEQQQLWHLGEWMRLQSGHPDAPKLREAANAIRWRGALAACALIWAALPAALLFLQWGQGMPAARLLLQGTYLHDRPILPGGASTIGNDANMLLAAWTVGLSLAYAFQWLVVQLHAADVRRYFEQFNAIVNWDGVAPLTPPQVGLGVGVDSIAGGILMILLGVFWGVPMLLAGTAQRRYISLAGGRSRAQAGEAVRMILSLRRPVMRAASFVTPTHVCRQQKCRNALSPLARFCPRCGARASVVIAEVA